MAQSGFRTVIVCHFALFTIPGSQKHPRITKNHKKISEFHLNFGEFHLRISGILHFWVDFWCHFTTSPYVSQTTPRRLPGDSQTAPRRLPDGSQTTPRRLPDDWEANLEPALPQAPVPAGNLIQYIVLYNSPVAREEQSVLAVTNRTVLHPKLLRPPPNTIIFLADATNSASRI